MSLSAMVQSECLAWIGGVCANTCEQASPTSHHGLDSFLENTIRKGKGRGDKTEMPRRKRFGWNTAVGVGPDQVQHGHNSRQYNYPVCKHQPSVIEARRTCIPPVTDVGKLVHRTTAMEDNGTQLRAEHRFRRALNRIYFPERGCAISTPAENTKHSSTPP